MQKSLCIAQWFFLLAMAVTLSSAQDASLADVRMRLSFTRRLPQHNSLSAVIWLNPLPQTTAAPFLSEHRYTLLQKNRTFKPHLIVIPVGGVVEFPNADPFFHNVFSLFDGKRFDLGLYEAGSTKSVTFSREGVSYIFCNIHPEMSAVVVTLSTRLYSVVDSSRNFHISNVPPGDYDLRVWIEGVAQPVLTRMGRRVHLAAGADDLGKIEVPADLLKPANHTNMYGQPYDHDVKRTY